MELGESHDFAVYGVPAVQMDGQVVSSTLIRQAVRVGDFSKAQRFLGRDYSVFGNVVQGQQLGRQLGFPTANLAVENEELPPNGVYAVRVGGSLPSLLKSYDSGQAASNTLLGVANLGLRPTVNTGVTERTLEVHLLDFDGDLYGKEMEVSFIKMLRAEQKFASLDELKAQIARDVELARQTNIRFAQHPA